MHLFLFLSNDKFKRGNKAFPKLQAISLIYYYLVLQNFDSKGQDVSCCEARCKMLWSLHSQPIFLCWTLNTL